VSDIQIVMIDVDFNMGDIVILKTDKDKKQRVVTCITLRPSNNICYGLSCGAEPETHHYAFEIEIKND